MMTRANSVFTHFCVMSMLMLMKHLLLVHSSQKIKSASDNIFIDWTTVSYI